MMRVYFAVFSLALLAACDPVHSNEVDALGDEAPGVRRGPLHRPGQPCLLCHDGKVGDPGEFSVAGTVFQAPISLTPAVGATVLLTDANGQKRATTTNAAGNFYLTPRDFTPAYPMTVSIEYGGTAVAMRTHIGRDGSCAGCHFDPAGWNSPGHVAVEFPDGGVP